MALVKQMTVKGITLEYWMITHLTQDVIANLTNVRVSPYANKATARREVNNIREGVKDAFFYLTLEFNFPGLLGRNAAYDAIKAQADNFFTSGTPAVDDVE